MNLERLLIDKIENRILVGIITFTAIMVIVGWISINETARMAAFEDQFEGRAIERGANLFNANCASCHGVDGRGLVAVAPGLNSPHLFGFSFTAAIDRELESLDIEAGSDAVTEERLAEIEARVAVLNTEREAIVAQMSSAVAAGYDPDEPQRLAQVSWGGTVEQYVYTTLVHGRPTSSSYWPSGNGMAAWAQRAGGPLREDQLDDLTQYVLNWNKDWTIDDLLAVNQFAIVPGTGGGEEVVGVGTDVDAIVVALEDVTGDPVNGQLIYTTYACAGCHAAGLVAPITDGQWANAMAGADGRPYAGDPIRYFVESIVAPNDFIVAGYNAGQMPQNFGDRMPLQDLADILAYIESYDM
jgi:mono/diheme cytochrome c family protein